MMPEKGSVELAKLDQAIESMAETLANLYKSLLSKDVPQSVSEKIVVGAAQAILTRKP